MFLHVSHLFAAQSMCADQSPTVSHTDEQHQHLLCLSTPTCSNCLHSAWCILQDYLTAPMPFLIGLQSSMLPMLKHLPMDEVTLIDLELGTCEPATGSPQDAARLLPWSDRLHAALQVIPQPPVKCVTH